MAEEDGEGEKERAALRLHHAHQAPGDEDERQLARSRPQCADRIAHTIGQHRHRRHPPLYQTGQSLDRHPPQMATQEGHAPAV